MARHRPPGNSSSDDERGGNGGPPAKRVKRFRHKSKAQAAKEVIRIEKRGMAPALNAATSNATAAAASTRQLISPSRIAGRCQRHLFYAHATIGNGTIAVWMCNHGAKCTKPPPPLFSTLSHLDAISLSLSLSPPSLFLFQNPNSIHSPGPRRHGLPPARPRTRRAAPGVDELFPGEERV